MVFLGNTPRQPLQAAVGATFQMVLRNECVAWKPADGAGGCLQRALVVPASLRSALACNNSPPPLPLCHAMRCMWFCRLTQAQFIFITNRDEGVLLPKGSVSGYVKQRQLAHLLETQSGEMKLTPDVPSPLPSPLCMSGMPHNMRMRKCKLVPGSRGVHACAQSCHPPAPHASAVLHKLRPLLAEHWLSNSSHGLEVCISPEGAPVSWDGWSLAAMHNSASDAVQPPCSQQHPCPAAQMQLH